MLSALFKMMSKSMISKRISMYTVYVLNNRLCERKIILFIHLLYAYQHSIQVQVDQS